VFVDAIQDACFLLLRRRPTPVRDPPPHMSVSAILTHGGLLSERGKVALPTDGSPWALPDPLLGASPNTLSLRQMGWRPTVGYLVANREAHRLHSHPSKGRVPLVWAAAVCQDGSFDFDRGRLSRQAGSRGYVDVAPHAKYVIREECVALQRTSSRSQERRLVAATIPEEFVRRHGGVVGENHTILLVRTRADAVPAACVVELLNSPEASAAFGRVGGSASISACLLADLPLPMLFKAFALQYKTPGEVAPLCAGSAISRLTKLCREHTPA
jgi:adenine-specific DNA-methyltransferase